MPQDDEPTSEHDQTSKALKGTYVAAIRPYFRDFRLETYRLFYAKLSEEDPDIIELQVSCFKHYKTIKNKNKIQNK